MRCRRAAGVRTSRRDIAALRETHAANHPMAMNDLLSQEEIDALLHGVSNGHMEAATDEPLHDGVARSYDFTSQDRLIRGRLPGLEMINERFARHLRSSLFEMLRRPADVSAGAVQMVTFTEYVQGLYAPTSLNLVRVKPLRGTALFVLDPRLVFSIVDSFFGGDGRLKTKIAEREFTPIETRVIQIALQRVFKGLKEAWAPVLSLEFEHLHSEVNPHLAEVVSPTEVVVASSFRIEFDGGGGDLHVTMPHFMIEPIRGLLEGATQGERSEVDQRWQVALTERMKEASVDLDGTLVETELTLRDVMRLKPGDVIPVAVPEMVTLRVEGVPTFRGTVGISDGYRAIKIVERARGYS
jgi:flagellar motor switch protein FliM